MIKKPLIIIAGPTASGKTDLGIEFAKLINGEIISADSMCVYKYMDIGTAKPSIEQRKEVVHYLIDVVFPDEHYNVVNYQSDALNAIDLILNKGKIPIIVGGTGFYIKSITDLPKFPKMDIDMKLRESLLLEAKQKGNEYMYKMLESIDKDAAKSVHPNNTKRVVRYLEIYYLTNRKPSEFLSEMYDKDNNIFEIVPICLTMERSLLRNRIDIRVDKMIKMGLIEEVENLLKMGYSNNLKSMQGLGYKQICDYLYGEITKDQAIEQIKLKTKQFAQRQITWFKYQGNFMYIDASDTSKNLAKKCFEISKSVV